MRWRQLAKKITIPIFLKVGELIGVKIQLSLEKQQVI